MALGTTPWPLHALLLACCTVTASSALVSELQGAAALLEAGQLTAAEFATVNSGCFRLAPRRHR